MNVSVIIVFLSFLLLGIILTLTISSYWYREKHTALETRAENISDYISMNLKTMPVDPNGRGDFVWANNNYTQYLNRFLNIYADDVDSDIIIIDNSCMVVMSISDNEKLAEAFPNKTL